MAGLIRNQFPNAKIYFLGNSYTKEIILCSEFIDEFINYDELEKLDSNEKIIALKNLNLDAFVHVFPKKEISRLAKQAKVPLRIGTTNRLYHWIYCNKLIQLSRKKSNLHESQLNIKLLKFLNINTDISLELIPTLYGFTKITELKNEYKAIIDPSRINLIFHPKSKGSAREWGINNFEHLIKLLPQKKYKIFISGTVQDGNLMQEFINNNSELTDLTGKLSLQQFIAFINACDGLIAASTGPLHIAAALNKKAIGLYSPMKPIDPGRWMPVGKDAHHLVINKSCSDCRKKNECACIKSIQASQILSILEK